MAEEKCQPEITIYKTCISKDNADIAFYWPSVTHFEMIFIEGVCSKYRGDVEKKKRKEKDTSFYIQFDDGQNPRYSRERTEA